MLNQPSFKSLRRSGLYREASHNKQKEISHVPSPSGLTFTCSSAKYRLKSFLKVKVMRFFSPHLYLTLWGNVTRLWTWRDPHEFSNQFRLVAVWQVHRSSFGVVVKWQRYFHTWLKLEFVSLIYSATGQSFWAHGWSGFKPYSLMRCSTNAACCLYMSNPCSILFTGQGSYSEKLMQTNWISSH